MDFFRVFGWALFAVHGVSSIVLIVCTAAMSKQNRRGEWIVGSLYALLLTSWIYAALQR